MTRYLPDTTSIRACTLLCSVCLLASCAKWVSACAPEAERMEGEFVRKLETGMEKGGDGIDHSAYGALLEAHVDESAGRVDYAGLKKEYDRLKTYLGQLARIDPARLDRPAQIALLLNAYNACTLDLVVRHYPDIDSIRDIDDPWSRPFCTVGGRRMTLDQIEHNLLRPIYRDPRIHFAVNCASIGCPPLADEPYTSEGLDAQLDRAARRTLQDERYAKLEGGELHLNPILNWYRSDFLSPRFQNHAETIPAFVARHATSEIASFVEKHDGSPPVAWMDYDWRLNDVE